MENRINNRKGERGEIVEKLCRAGVGVWVDLVDFLPFDIRTLWVPSPSWISLKLKADDNNSILKCDL